ncbi:hypothetical protein [Plantactinospora sp. GCM10030261]|uniref:hypothetical protein n=1 Tax=Plantactinospora sp. GCM10030261 TaxID=3273420 RepID=UPI00361A4F36
MVKADLAGARRLTRWLSPAGLFLAGLLLLLPFVAVSCDAPGGYGRGSAGSTTTYTGADLVTGDEPAVSPPDQVLPPERRRDDTLGVRPLAVTVLVLILAALITATGIATPWRRRLVTAILAATAALTLVAEQVAVRSVLAARLRDQLTTPLPADKRVEDYVQTQPGFWLCLLTLIAVAAANSAALLRGRRP